MKSLTFTLLFRMILIYDLIYFNNKCSFKGFINLVQLFLCLFQIFIGMQQIEKFSILSHLLQIRILKIKV